MTSKPGLIQSPLDSGTHENVFLSPRTKVEVATRRKTREQPKQALVLLLIHNEIRISSVLTNEQLGPVRGSRNEFANLMIRPFSRATLR